MPKITETAFTVLDTETTGATPGKDKPIEIAMVRLQGDFIGEPVSWFIDPHMRIPPEASAVHHLTDEDIKGALTLEELEPRIREFIGDSVVMAHNAQFDMAMLPFLDGHPYLCTLRVARRLWEKGEPNADGFPLASHQQQVLRYWLNLKVDTLGLAAHRAAADILVTARLFQVMAQYYLDCGGEDDMDAFKEFLERPIEITRMPFGKYSGELLADVREDYLVFMLEQDKKPLEEDLRASIKRELDRRKAKNVIANRVGTPASKS